MDNNAVKASTVSFENIEEYQQMLLNNVFVQKLQENEKQTKIFTDYKKKHKKVIEGLQIFPLSVSENCMVPIGKRAFMKGKLTHTNEILVSLGSSYFAKYSASQAIALCNRRISWADEMLKSLQAERSLYEMRQILPMQHDVFGEKDKKDILEHWNKDELDKWRIQHRQRQKEYHQKLTEKREEIIDTRTDEDIFSRLDELELEEELENEISRLEDERKQFYGNNLKQGEVYEESEEDYDDDDDDDDDTDDSDKITAEVLQEELKRFKDLQVRVTNTSNVPHSDEVQAEIVDKDNIENKQSNPIVNSTELMEVSLSEPKDVLKSADIKKTRRVSFAEPCDENPSNIKDETAMFHKTCTVMQVTECSNKDLENDDIVRIEFSHSPHIPNVAESNNTEVLSPTDIYNMFSTPKKSILKRSPNDMVPNQSISPPNGDSSTDTESEDADVKPSIYCSVIKDIQERPAIPVNNIEEKKDKKIVSRFKMERAGIRK